MLYEQQMRILLRFTMAIFIKKGAVTDALKYVMRELRSDPAVSD
jgi:hypothetical protein